MMITSDLAALSITTEILYKSLKDLPLDLSELKQLLEETKLPYGFINTRFLMTDIFEPLYKDILEMLNNGYTDKSTVDAFYVLQGFSFEIIKLELAALSERIQ
jgi:hypothetical protein